MAEETTFSNPLSFEDETFGEVVDKKPGKKVANGAASPVTGPIVASSSDDSANTEASLKDSAASLAKKTAQILKAKNLRKFTELNIFGSTNEVDEKDYEDEQFLRARWGGLLHPNTGVSQAYDGVQTIFLVYILVNVPWRIGFNTTATPDMAIYWIDIIVDVALLFDLVLNFFRFTIDPRTLSIVTDSKLVRTNYLWSWFWIDFVSVVPWDLIMKAMASTGSQNKAAGMRMVRMARLVKFARLTRLAKLTNIRKVMSHFNKVIRLVGISKPGLSFIFKILLLFMMVIAAMHVLGCLWVRQVMSNFESNEFGWYSHNYGGLTQADNNTVIPALDAGGKRVWRTDQGPEARVSSHWNVYVDAAYFILVTMSSVGYGDMLPVTTGERMMSILVIIFGTFVWAYIIGSFSTTLAIMSEDKAKYEGKMRGTAELLKFLQVDEQMMTAINHYFEYKFVNKTMFDEQQIYNDLPAKLRADLLMHRFRFIIEKVPFFRGCRDDAIVEICSSFKSFSVLPNEYIVQRGDPYRELVVLTKGISVSVPESEEMQKTDGMGVDIVIEYPSGSFFGELEFLGFGSERQVSIKSKTFCEVSSLHPDDMEEVLRVHVKLKRRLERYGQLKKDLSDLQKTLNEGAEKDELEVEQLKQKIEDGWLDENVELRKVFDSVDSDGSGTLTRAEIFDLAKQMGKEMTKKELDKCMKLMDSDGSGTVDYEEFAEWWETNDGSFKMTTKSSAALEHQMKLFKDIHDAGVENLLENLDTHVLSMDGRMLRTENMLDSLTDEVQSLQSKLDRIVKAVCKK